MTNEQKKFIATLINRLNNLEVRVTNIERKDPNFVQTVKTVEVPTNDKWIKSVREEDINDYELDYNYYAKGGKDGTSQESL